MSTPFDHNSTIVPSSISSDQVAFPYREAVGSLNFLATVTRPDIAFAVGVAGRHMQNPNHLDVRVVKRIMRYVKGTLDYALRYKFKKEVVLVGYCDADYAGDTETRRSTSGLLMLVAGGLVTWASRRQRVVAQSTTEAEYVASAEACKETVWQKRLIEELVGQIPMPMLLVDNQSALKLIENPVLHHGTKHIDIRYHYIRNEVANKTLCVGYVPTAQQLADVLTKGLAKAAHESAMEALGLRKVEM